MLDNVKVAKIDTDIVNALNHTEQQLLHPMKSELTHQNIIYALVYGMMILLQRNERIRLIYHYVL